MKQKRKRELAGSKPKVFHPNSTCSQYQLGETDFLQENIFTSRYKDKLAKKHAALRAWLEDPKVPATYKLSHSYYYLDQLARCHEWTDTGRRYTDDVWKYVVQAIREYGLDALILNNVDKWRLKCRTSADTKRSISESIAHFNAIGKGILEKFPGVPRQPGLLAQSI